MLIRTLVREWISGCSTTLRRRAGLCTVGAILTSVSLSSMSAAGDLPSLESLLTRQQQKSKPVPARVKQETMFDVIDTQWEKPAIPVEPASTGPEGTAKLEPIPADAVDLIESIEGSNGSGEVVTRALPSGPLTPPKELQPGPPATRRGPVLVQRQPAPAAEETQTSTPKRFVLGSLEVEKLITRARKELQSGDIAMAHAFTEAAAETEIPITLFEENASLLIDEVALVRDLQFQRTAAWQAGELPAPDVAAEPETLATSIEQQPHVWRALGGTKLNTAPPAVDRDGSRQELPEARGLRLLSQVPQMNQTMGTGRGWEPISYSWEAPALKYNPLYFEDPQLERHGNEIAYIQPAISAGRFFATLPTLPYQMAIEDNGVCHTVYDLGNDRPGDCVPYSIPILPWSLTGALTQGGAATALVFILP